jgi:37-kD nucleoid-associated bacterial protein
MIIENLNIGRIAIHEVFQREEDRKSVPPIYADQLEHLPDDAIATFKVRITEALSAQAKSIEMQIVDADANSHVANAAYLIAANDEKFLTRSRSVADRLVHAQMSRNIPGGMLIVFDGTVGAANYAFVGTIKAETQSGFRRHEDAKKKIITEFLNNVFLTPATRLFKIAMFVQEDKSVKLLNGWRAFVFDNNISQSHRESAAQYFYEGFLGCVLPEDGAYETSRFFDITKEFVRKSGLSGQVKRKIVDALITFVQADNAKTFTADEFAQKYLPVDMRDPFGEFAESKKFPMRAVVRDTSQMASKLKRRRFRFGSDIEFSVTPEALNNKTVILKTGKSTEFGGDGKELWTQITIKQPMTDER